MLKVSPEHPPDSILAQSFVHIPPPWISMQSPDPGSGPSGTVVSVPGAAPPQTLSPTVSPADPPTTSIPSLAIHPDLSASSSPSRRNSPSEFRAAAASYTAQFLALYLKSFYAIRNNPGLLFSLFFWPVFFVLMLEALHQFQFKPVELVNFEDTVGKGGGSLGNELGIKYPDCKYWDAEGVEMNMW